MVLEQILSSTTAKIQANYRHSLTQRMIPLSLLAWVLFVVGAVSVLAEIVANRYHSRRFREHIAAIERSDPDEMPEDFLRDWRVKLAERVMVWGPMIGIPSLGAGATLLVVS